MKLKVLKKLGIVLTEVNLQEFAYSQHINKKVRDMTQAEKVQLRYNYIMDVTKKLKGTLLEHLKKLVIKLEYSRKGLKNLESNLENTYYQL